MTLWVIRYFIILMKMVIYNPGIGLSQQSTFDYNLRGNLEGYNYNDINWIDIDNLDPDQLRH